MRVLVIGSGGREHTLAWKISRSPRVEKIYSAPGNGGISQLAECVDIKAEDISALAHFAEEKRIDLTLVGPEAPLTEGIVDKFTEKGLKIFGPTKEGVRLEGSKVFAKKLMEKYDIPMIQDFRGKFSGQSDFQIYTWAKAEYWNRCSKECVVWLGGEHGETMKPGVVDWGMHNKAFFQDLSCLQTAKGQPAIFPGLVFISFI